MSAPPRLPFEPILRYLRARYPDDDITAGFVAVHVGISLQSAHNYIRRGVDVWHADGVAVRTIGVHPCLVWPEWCDLIDSYIEAHGPEAQAERRRVNAVRYRQRKKELVDA